MPMPMPQQPPGRPESLLARASRHMVRTQTAAARATKKNTNTNMLDAQYERVIKSAQKTASPHPESLLLNRQHMRVVKGAHERLPAAVQQQPRAFRCPADYRQAVRVAPRRRQRAVFPR